MSAATPRRISTHLARIAALAGAVCATQPLDAVRAAPPAPSASASAAATAGPVEKSGLAVSAYAWPAELSPEPREEDWAGATELTSAQVDIVSPFFWLPSIHGVVCTQRALGSWLRLTCTPPHDSEEGEVFVGALWGLAGDVGKVKGSFVLASELERHKTPAMNRVEAFNRKMGASATITLPVTPGSALLLRLDRIQWDFGYEESTVGTRPGVIVDVSWALGEKYPTILYR
jgi:hypothetical protein